MKVEIKEKNFCELVDSIEEFWYLLDDIRELIGIDLSDSRLSDLMDSVAIFLTDIFNNKVDSFSLMDDISYYMWELDFGKKWEPGMVVIDGKDIPLRNSHDLWKLICSNMEEGKNE